MKGYRFLLIFAFLFYGIVYGGSWSFTGSTKAFRGGFNSATFTDGRIMAVGGNASPACSTYEVFDPSTGAWTMFFLDSTYDISDHETGILLPSGKGLFESFHRQLFTYDPMTSTWFKTRWWPNTGAGSLWQCVTLLKNGKVLLPGHPYGRNTFVYEWRTDTLYQVGNMSGSSSQDEHGNAAEVILPNGKAMIIGGQTLLVTPRADCEIYDEGTRTWSMVDSMNQARTKLVAVLLRPPYQKVLVASSGQAELYDPVANSWAYTAALNVGPRLIATACLLPNGKVLIMGGSDLSSCELYDPAAQTWTLDASMAVGRHHFTSAILPTGKIISIGDEGATGDQRCEIYDPIDGNWESQDLLSTGRIAPSVTLLPSVNAPGCSTSILITGGENGSGTALSSCELFDFKKNITVLTGSMNTARTHHTLNLLPDINGKVIVAGGKNASGALDSCEIYDEATGTWSNTGALTTARFDHTATLLKDGRILVTGGENSGGYLNSCEIWNGSSWTNTGSMTTSRARHSAVLLLDGRVMVIGGQTTGGTTTNTCEIYDPAIGTWSSTPNLLAGRSLHSSVLLQSGKILVIGGQISGGMALSGCEIYVPDSSLWRSAGSLHTGRYAHNATLTYAGLVLVSGGDAGDSGSCELYDPATNEWKTTGKLATGRSYHASVLVPYLHPYVYVIGGRNGGPATSSIERFDFGLGYQSDWQSRILNYPSVTHIADSMSILGSLFRDFSEGDGGNYCHIASTDHPIISLVRIGGGNWQGNGGGEILHMPLSSYWDTSHTVVHPQVSDFEGYYRIWSIVNGIPSKWPSSTGIEENENCKIKNEKLKIWPNPFTLQTVISKSSMVNGNKIRIYDVSGKMVEETDKTVIGKNLKAGIYFVKAGNSEPTKIVKLSRLK